MFQKILTALWQITSLYANMSYTIADPMKLNKLNIIIDNLDSDLFRVFIKCSNYVLNFWGKEQNVE